MKAEKMTVEIIVVDDGSTDKTRALALRLARKHGEIKVISYPENRGKGYAVKKGIEASSNNYILFTDADNATPISELKKLERHAEIFDIVIGSRYLPTSFISEKQTLIRRFVGYCATLIIKSILVTGLHDTRCGFKLFRKEVAKHLIELQTIDGWSFDTELLAIATSLGYAIHEVPVSWKDSGQTKIKIVRDSLIGFSDICRIRWNLATGLYLEAIPLRQFLEKNESYKQYGKKKNSHIQLAGHSASSSRWS